jgi:hypothetical protein
MTEWSHVMRRCAFRQGGSISRWSTPSTRCYTSEPSATDDGALRLGDGLVNLGQSPQNGAVEKASRTQHTSIKHENGAFDSSVSSPRRPLPLSPLMDPVYLAAKQKYRHTKAAPSKEPTPFQQQLAKNPYGMT